MNTNKLLSNLLVGGIFLIPFIPFIVPDSMFFPFITGKNFTFRILIEILLGLWIVLAYRDAAYRPAKSPLLIVAASFVGVMVLAGMFGANPFKSFWSNYERMEGVVSLLHFLAFFVMASTVFRVREKWNAFWNVSLVASVLMSGYALLQLGGAFEIHQGSTRVDATLGNAAYLAVYMLFHIFLAFYMMLRVKGQSLGGMIVEKASVWLYAPIIVLDTFILYHTATRGAILGLIGGLIFTALLVAIFEKERVRLRKAAVGLLVGLVVLVGGFFALKNTAFVRESQVLNRFATISLTEQTTKSRFMVWNMAYQGFKERPILGWGQESFNFVFNKYYDPGMYAQEPWFDRAHNVFLDWLIAGGILGLLSYLSLFGVALWYLWRRGSLFSIVEKSIITGLFAGYFFHNLFVFDNLMSYVMFFAVLAFLESVHRGETKPVVESGKKEKKRVAPNTPSAIDLAVVPAAIILTVTMLYYFNAKPLVTNYTLIDALKPQGNPMLNLEDFKKVFSYGSFGTTEGREQLMQITTQVLGVSQVDTPTKQAFADLAISEMKQQIKDFPGDARYELFLGSFLTELARYNNGASLDEGIAHLEQAHTLSPKKQSIIFQLGSVYYNKKDTAKATALFKEAYDLAPEYLDAENYYLKVMMDEKNYTEIKRVLEAHIVRVPNDADPHTKLSALYFEMGRPQDAIAEINRAIELNPAFKEQGESYIRAIREGRRP